ncbi:MAG: PDZ domain-containing protein [Clostridia bacterium]|nr:PDZ domain-containing protein [Clostridia bacterium]
MYRTKKWLIGFVLLLVFLLPAAPGAWAAQEDVELLAQIKRIVEGNYVDPVEPAVLEAATIEELFEKLDDPHSGYLTPKQFEDFQISSSQEYAGVGMQLVQKEEYVEVVTVFPNTPAERVGVQPGDIIRAVNGEDMTGRSLEEVAALIRGKEGTAVLIEFFRESTGEQRIVSLTRELIHLEVLEHRLEEGNIGYIRVKSFTPTVGREFDQVLKDLRSQGMQGLILDLRQNPGGYLTAALDIGSHFAGVGEPLLHIEGRDSDPVSYQSLTQAFDLPVAVLVDEGSASASEIVAGIIRDSGAGRVFGTTTFGKASVQTLFTLPQGGAVKLTTARYLTPNKVDLNGVGLVPDEIIEEPEEQLQAAIAYLQQEIAKRPAPSGRVLVLRDNRALFEEKEVVLSPEPIQREGQLLVPFRQLGEIFNIQVDWDGTNNQALASKGDKEELRVAPGSGQALINGQVQTLEVPPVLQEGRLLVPVRLLADFMGGDCVYDGATQTVTVTW